MSAAEMPAGAAPGRAPDWHSIDWKKVWRTVRRLQARIVKAVREGRWNKVKALVYLLTHSFGGRALAISTSDQQFRCDDSRRGRNPLEHAGGQVGRFPAPCVGTATDRNRSAGCTSPKATASGAPWDSDLSFILHLFATGLGIAWRNSGPSVGPTLIMPPTAATMRDESACASER